jgi:hypothetical protein
VVPYERIVLSALLRLQLCFRMVAVVTWRGLLLGTARAPSNTLLTRKITVLVCCGCRQAQKTLAMGGAYPAVQYTQLPTTASVPAYGAVQSCN